MKDRVLKSEEDWRKQLTPEQFRVLRKKGTERAFTGESWNQHEPALSLRRLRIGFVQLGTEV